VPRVERTSSKKSPYSAKRQLTYRIQCIVEAKTHEVDRGTAQDIMLQHDTLFDMLKFLSGCDIEACQLVNAITCRLIEKHCNILPMRKKDFRVPTRSHLIMYVKGGRRHRILSEKWSCCCLSCRTARPETTTVN